MLVLKDDISSYTWLHTTDYTDAESATTASVKWIAAFGSMKWLVSDRGSHFTFSVTSKLTEDANIRHHFTTAYFLRANGTVERLCKEVLRAARSLLSQWKLPGNEWPSIIESVQALINKSPVERIGKDPDTSLWRTPLQVFTGMKLKKILVRPSSLKEVSPLSSLEEKRALEVVRISHLHDALHEMHKEVVARNDRRRTKAQKVHNAHKSVVPINFHVGDYVLVATKCARSHKLDQKWKGQMKVVKALSDLVFQVQSLENVSTETVHAQRMTHYPALKADEEVTNELREHATFVGNAQHLVQELTNLREKRRL